MPSMCGSRRGRVEKNGNLICSGQAREARMSRKEAKKHGAHRDDRSQAVSGWRKNSHRGNAMSQRREGRRPDRSWTETTPAARIGKNRFGAIK